MSHYFFYYTARPFNYRDYALAHAARVTAAGGTGADVDFLESYYRLIGVNTLVPRAYFNLRCGYRLDANDLVEYVFDPHQADLEQADPALRASVVLDAHSQPMLLFTGSQLYQAVDTSHYQVGKRDLVHFVSMQVAQNVTFTLYNLPGVYYTAHYGAGSDVTVSVLSAPERFYDQYQPYGGLATPPLNRNVTFNSYVIRGNQTSRTQFGNIYTPGVANQANNQAVQSTGSYTMGDKLVGSIREMLNLADGMNAAPFQAIWDFIGSHD